MTNITTQKADWRTVLKAIAGLSAIAAGSAHADCLEGGYALGIGGIIDVVPHPGDPDTLFVLQSAPAPDGVSLLKSCDNGATWTPTSLTADFYTVTSVAIDPTDPETMYAMTYRGPLVSSNGGITWSETTIPGGELVYGFDGTLYSHDVNRIQKLPADGSGWTELTPVPQGFDVLRPHPNDASRLHVGSHYSVDGGMSWQRVLPGVVRDIRYSPGDPMRMIATATPALLSDDGGVNWYEPPSEEFEIFSYSDPDGTAVAFDNADSNVLWVVTQSCGIWRSDSGGARWGLPDDGLTGDPASCWMGEGYVNVKRLVPSPADTDRWYAETSDGLFVSNDDGGLWTPINGEASADGPPPPPNPYSGDADLSVSISGVPKSFTPPTTIKYSGELRNNGPDTAREVTFAVAGSGVVTSSSYPGCDGGTCDFGDLPAGTVIRMTFKREILGGGSGTRCTGDVLEVIISASATTNDPNAANNVASADTVRKNGTSIISGCPGEGLLQPVGEQDSGGGGASGLGFLAMLGGLVACRRRRTAA